MLVFKKKKYLGWKSWPDGLLSQFFGAAGPTSSKHERGGNKRNQNGKREVFSLSLSLSIWALSHWAKQGQRDSTKKTVGQHEERIAVAADACGLDTHGPLCVRSRTVKRPNVQNLKD